MNEEMVGYKEALLISTILDPQFKLMNFPGCTNEMKEDAQNYLHSAYRIDWCPSAVAKAQRPSEVAEGVDKDYNKVKDLAPTISFKAVALLFKNKV